jgi:hypothetical protein
MRGAQKRNSLPIKKMEVAHFKVVVFAGLCISFSIEKIIYSLNLGRKCPGREVGGTARRSTSSAAAPLGARKMGWIVAS